MSVAVKELPNREIELTIEISPKELASFREQAAKFLSEKVKVDGFRQGKAPVEAIIQSVGEPTFLQTMFDLAIPQTYLDAIKKEKIEPITRPIVNIISPEPLVYTAKVALMPEVKLKNIDKLKIKREDVKADKDEIEGTIMELRKYKAKYTKVDRPAKEGDRVEIDFEGFDKDGKSLDQTKSKHHPLILGEGRFVPGFEAGIVGMKKGETKRFTVKFPKDYDREDFRNKEVEFEITVHEVESVDLPPIDEEFTKEIIGKPADEKEFREAVAADIVRQKESRELQRQQGELFTKLIEHADIEYSELLIESELDYMQHQQEHELKHRGLTWEQFSEMLEKQGRNWREEAKPEAKQRVETRHTIRQLIQDKDIKASDQEIKDLLKAQGVDLKEVTDDEHPAYQQANEQLLLDQIFKMFLEQPK